MIHVLILDAVCHDTGIDIIHPWILTAVLSYLSRSIIFCHTLMIGVSYGINSGIW